MHISLNSKQYPIPLSIHKIKAAFTSLTQGAVSLEHLARKELLKLSEMYWRKEPLNVTETDPSVHIKRSEEEVKKKNSP
jgi:hypothetical protein